MGGSAAAPARSFGSFFLPPPTSFGSVSSMRAPNQCSATPKASLNTTRNANRSAKPAVSDTAPAEKKRAPETSRDVSFATKENASSSAAASAAKPAPSASSSNASNVSNVSRPARLSAERSAERAVSRANARTSRPTPKNKPREPEPPPDPAPKVR